ncbi:MAG: T9SS type A sorting domain-containing protein [Saprospiraceae bacterium]
MCPVVSVLDVNGKQIQTLVNQQQSAGKHQILGDFSKKSFPNGIYFIQMKLDNQLIMKKILVQK